MKIAVFLGPSLKIDIAREHLDADYLPPARMGDIYRAVQDGRPAIGLVDGLFEQTPAVWHKEVLFAIDCGVAVFGGSSMGALRAAELHDFGMYGVGRIFEDFASGKLEDDDEVAVVHGTSADGYASQSEAMVNIRHGLHGAREAGVIDAAQLGALLAHAKAKFYPDRCWQDVVAHAGHIAPGCGARLAQFLERTMPDQKRDDAIAVLHALRDWTEKGCHAAPPTFHFEQTRYWDNVVSHFGATAPGSAETATYVERVNTHVRLADPDRVQILERALLLYLAEREARRIGIANADIDQRLSMEAFRRKRALHSPEALACWMEANHIDRAGCIDLARMEGQLQALARLKAPQVDAYLVTALKLAGRYPAVAAHAARKWQSGQVRESRALLGNDDATLALALDWYQDRFGNIAGSLPAYAAELRLSESEFLEEVLVEYLYSVELAREGTLEA